MSHAATRRGRTSATTGRSGGSGRPRNPPTSSGSDLDRADVREAGAVALHPLAQLAAEPAGQRHAEPIRPVDQRARHSCVSSAATATSSFAGGVSMTRAGPAQLDDAIEQRGSHFRLTAIDARSTFVRCPREIRHEIEQRCAVLTVQGADRARASAYAGPSGGGCVKSRCPPAATTQ